MLHVEENQSNPFPMKNILQVFFAIKCTDYVTRNRCDFGSAFNMNQRKVHKFDSSPNCSPWSLPTSDIKLAGEQVYKLSERENSSFSDDFNLSRFQRAFQTFLLRKNRIVQIRLFSLDSLNIEHSAGVLAEYVDLFTIDEYQDCVERILFSTIQKGVTLLNGHANLLTMEYFWYYNRNWWWNYNGLDYVKKTRYYGSKANGSNS